MADVVIDVSALVDLLLGNRVGSAVALRIADERLHAPAHLSAEVLSALGRLYCAGRVTETEVDAMVGGFRAAPIVRHDLVDLVPGTWARRLRLSLVGALYVEPAERTGAPLITTDLRLRGEPHVGAMEA